MPSPAHLPNLPRFENLVERIGIILDRNPEAFPAPIAAKLAVPPIVVPEARFKWVYEHDGEIEARALLDWDAAQQRLVICADSFLADDEREPADDLDAPTILAWRLLEDLSEIADGLEGEMVDAGTWTPEPEPQSVTEMAALTDTLIAENPQFFPPWLVEKLELGVQVLDSPLADDPEAMGLFDYDPQTGSRIFIIHPNMLAEIDGLGAAALARELLVTLCHEYEHHYGNVRGRDPLGNREWYFDRHWLP